MKRLVSILLSASFLIGQAQIINNAEHLTISSFNDSWGGGFTQIKDDLRSFGFQADYQHRFYGERVTQIIASWSGMTNKFDSYPEPARIDEMQLAVRLPILGAHSDWHLDGIIGGNIYGNFGGEAFQNRAHEAAGVPLLDLPYSDQYDNFVKLGTQVWGDFTMSEYANGSSFKLLTVLRGIYGIMSYADVNLSVAAAYQTMWGDQLQFNLGYRYHDAMHNDVFYNVTQAERGIYFNYSMRLGLLNYSMTVYPDGNFSTGSLGVSLFNWNGRTSLQEVDAMAELGSLSDANGFYLRYLWNGITGHNDHFQFDLHYQFWTLANAKLPAYPNRYGHYQQFSLGGNYSFIKPKNTFQVLPYVSLRIGYKDERTYAGELPGPDYNVWSFNAIGEGGLRIKLPANVIHKNCYYGLTMNYQYVATLYQSTDYQLVSAYPFAQNLGYFGLGGFVMIDL